ncbi:uncharacterized protein [Dermacentor andersoni]|uniref:uncharacterized protein isoform X2 n=1 Tax=Dermacentor andersoni TaxID=34620 RepID=UPI0024175C65|nr:uncharacterized protein LOC126542188 isoform X2 [Dermacentor andersoni]
MACGLHLLVLVAAALCPLATIDARSTCGRKSGVVKSVRSASIGAEFLGRCGRHLLLKYNIDTGAFYKVVERFCLVTHLCYAVVEKYSDNMTLFQDKIVDCYRRYALLVVATRPDLLGEELSNNIDKITRETRVCMKKRMPKDKDVMLGVIRYIRRLFFMA